MPRLISAFLTTSVLVSSCIGTQAAQSVRDHRTTPPVVRDHRVTPPRQDVRVVNVGGVNLNSYCKATFGQAFKSRLIGSTAGDWTCEQSAGNRRPISVEAACKMQYQGESIFARAMNWNDPGSWRCFVKA